MPIKKQRSLSLSQDYYDKIEKMLEQNKEALKKIDCDSVIGLIRLLINYGEEPLLKMLATVADTS